MVEGMYVVVNVMVSLMSLINPPPALCNLSARTIVKLGVLGVLGFLNCNDMLLSALHRRMVEGSNNRFYAYRPMVSPQSNWHPGPLVDWWPPPFNQQVPHLHGSRPQIRDM